MKTKITSELVSAIFIGKYGKYDYEIVITKVGEVNKDIEMYEYEFSILSNKKIDCKVLNKMDKIAVEVFDFIMEKGK